jgi:hypothetical protein
MSSRSNGVFPVAIAVRGDAAAAAPDRVAGLGPTMRLSNGWISALAPGRAIKPA